MKTGENCTSGLKLKLATPERHSEATGSIHRQGDEQDEDDDDEVVMMVVMMVVIHRQGDEQEEEEDEGNEGLEGAMMACRPQATARPLCLRGRMTRDEVEKSF